MKKLLFIILFLPVLSFAQYETNDPVYDLKPSVLNFEKFKGSPTDYELPYLRYSLLKCFKYRMYGYAASVASVAIASVPLFYTESKFLEKHPREDYSALVKKTNMAAGGIGLVGIGFFIASEVWFKRSSIKPTLSDDGIGVVIKF